MKIIFCGGKHLGYSILKHLIESNEEIVAVFANPSDAQTERWFPSVAELAQKNDIPVYIDINSQLSLIRRIHPAMLVCAYYDLIIKESILNEIGRSINIHMGLIQEYRGCYPTTMPIYNGDDHAGITIHEITKEVDSGVVYAQARIDINDYDTGETLYYKCVGLALNTFKLNWEFIKSGEIKTEKVDASKARIYKRSEFPSLNIPINHQLDRIDRRVRALTFKQFDKPYFIHNGKKFEINYVGQS